MTPPKTPPGRRTKPGRPGNRCAAEGAGTTPTTGRTVCRTKVCPSCGAKRAAQLGAFVIEEVVEDVGHAQWVFTWPVTGCPEPSKARDDGLQVPP